MNLKQLLFWNKLLCRQKAVCEDELVAARQALADCEAIPDCPDCPDLPTDCDQCCLTIFRGDRYLDSYTTRLQSFDGATWNDIDVLTVDFGSTANMYCIDGGLDPANVRIVIQGIGDFDGENDEVILNENPFTDYSFTDLGEGQFAVTLDNLGGTCFNNIVLELPPADPVPLGSVYYAACIGSTTIDVITTYDVDDNVLQTFPLGIDTTGSVRIALENTDLIKKIIINTTIGSSTDTQINVCIATDTVPCINGGQFSGNPIGDLTVTGLDFPADAIILIYVTCDACSCT